MITNNLNSEYTTKLANIDKSDIFDFDFTLYGSTTSEAAAHKTAFIDRFYKYFYFKEINGDSVYAFNRRLEEVMAEWLDRFNVLFKEQETSMTNRSLIGRKVTSQKDIDGTIDDEFDTITNEHTSKYLDTPQTPYNASTEDKYATSINKDSDDTNTTNNRVIDTTELKVDNIEDKSLVENLDIVYKKYRDLDMELIRKFKDCFLKIY